MPSRIHKKSLKRRSSRRTIRGAAKSRRGAAKSRRGAAKSRRGAAKSRRGAAKSRRSQQQGGFWLKDLIFGRKTKYSNVIPATQARNAFLGPYRQFEKSGADLIEAHEKKERNLAQLQESLNEAMANVQSTAGNVAKFKELQMSYRQAAKQIADEYNRDISAAAATNKAAAAANNSAKRNNVSTIALLKNSNMKLNKLQQQIQQLQGSTPPPPLIEI